MTSYTLINYFRKLLEFFWVQRSDMYKLKKPLGVFPRKQDASKQDDDNNDKNTQKLLQSRLLDVFTILRKSEWYESYGERLKELLLIKFQAYSL